MSGREISQKRPPHRPDPSPIRVASRPGLRHCLFPARPFCGGWLRGDPVERLLNIGWYGRRSREVGALRLEAALVVRRVRQRDLVALRIGVRERALGDHRLRVLRVIGLLQGSGLLGFDAVRRFITEKVKVHFVLYSQLE